MAIVTRTDVIHAPSLKDSNEWLPGGYYANSVYAGGDMFAIDRKMETSLGTPQGGSSGLGLSYGLFSTMLNGGYAKVISDSTGGLLDLITDYDFRETVVLYYTIDLTLPDGSSLTYSTGTITYNDGSNNEPINSVHTVTSMNDVAAAYGNQRSLTSLMSTPGLISLGVDLGYGFYKGTLNTDLKTLAGGIAIGTVKSTISSQVTGIVNSAAGVTSIGTGIAVGVVVGMIVGELFEMALGLDNHFGLGGEYTHSDISGQDFGSGVVAGVNDSYHASYTPAQTLTAYVNNLLAPVTDFLGITYDSGISIDNSMSAEDRATTALEDYYNDDTLSVGDYDGNDGYGSLESATEQTAAESEQRSVTGDSFGSDFSAGSTEFEDAHYGGATGSDSSSDSERYCCTVMVKHGMWDRRKLVHLGVWDKKQDVVWRTGYPVGGKLVAKVFDRSWLLSYYEKMMDGFYNTHVLGHKRTIWTYNAYVFIYPAVYVAGLVTLAARKLNLKKI